MNSLLKPDSILLHEGLAFIRIIIGALIIYHGIEVFDSEVMMGYLSWDSFKNPNGKLLVYVGKSTELTAGVLLFLGFFTRLGCMLLIGTMLYITFFVGHGRFWYEEQHPFLFAILGLVYFFYGSGEWSLDNLIQKERH